MSEKEKLSNMDLDNLLKHDPLDSAKNALGSSYKDDRSYASIGHILLEQNSKDKEEALEKDGDTTFKNNLNRYLDIVKGIGFETIYEQKFKNSDYQNEDQYFIMARRDGLLLSFDTNQGNNINGSTLYYNWRANDCNDKYYNKCTSGGRFHFPAHMDRMTAPMTEATWIGKHDAREALVFKISQLEEFGNFINPWVSQPSLFLRHHDDDSYSVSVESRVDDFPEWAKEIFIPEYRNQCNHKI